MTANSSIAQITIDDRFFEVAAAQSSRYGRLWVIAKETIQNSQDAGASRIDFTLQGDYVRVEDDGPGMGPTGGIANFLTIGASAKNADSSTTGYFSTAKVRICFIHKDWAITTGREYLSKSMLGRESIKQLSSKEAFDGCKIEIQSRNGPWDVSEIEEYVSLCNPDIKVYIDGKRVRRTYRRGQLKANFYWADAYVNRGDKARRGTLVVRVNGLTMFTRSLYNVNAQVTLELDPELSHLALQENREELVWKATTAEGDTFYPRSELDTFVSGLIVNPRSVKPANKTVIEFVEGSERALPVLEAQFEAGRSELNAHTETVTVENPPIVVMDTGQGLVNAGKITMEELADLIETGEVIPNCPGRPIQLSTGKWVWSGEDHLPEDICLQWKQEATELADGRAQVIGDTEMPDPKMRKFRRIFPYDYVVKHESNRPAPHTKHARVLAAWKELLDVLSREIGLTSEFGVGLCVDQEARAEFIETKYGEFFLIDYREFKSTGGQLPQTMKMIRLAAHELTHARGYEDHDEAFIIEESRIFDVAMENLQALRAATKGLTVYSRYTYNHGE